MSDRARIRQVELARIFKAAKSAGTNVRVTIRPDSTIEITMDDAAVAEKTGRSLRDKVFDKTGRNPWDEVFEKQKPSDDA